MERNESFKFYDVCNWMILLFNIGKKDILLVSPTYLQRKFDDWSGVQLTTDGVKASLHFSQLNMQPEEADINDSKIEKRNDVFVVTIGPNGANLMNVVT